MLEMNYNALSTSKRAYYLSILSPLNAREKEWLARVIDVFQNSSIILMIFSD